MIIVDIIVFFELRASKGVECEMPLVFSCCRSGGGKVNGVLTNSRHIVSCQTTF